MKTKSIEKLNGKLKIKHGFPFLGKHFSTSGCHIILTPGNFHEKGGFKHQHGKEKYYSGHYPQEYIHKKDDLIVAMTEQTPGLLGSCAFVPESDKYLHNQRLGLIACDSNCLDSVFVYYLFQTNFIRRQIQFSSTGTKVKHTSPEGLYDLKFPVSDLQSQVAIASVLQGFDKKIELNQKINAELESLAKTIYDYWFVQFDFPDDNGQPYKSSGGAMIFDDVIKREIPAGWRVSSLFDFAEFFNGLALQNLRPTSSNYLPVIKIREMSDGITKKTEKARVDIPEEAIIDDGDVLFSWSATLEVKIWSGGRGALNQHIFKVTSKNYPKYFYFFELKRYLTHFKMLADLRKTTMGHITQDHLKQAQIVLPPREVLKKLDGVLSPILGKQLNLEKQNLMLSETRDWLLPMLMNGQVTVSSL